MFRGMACGARRRRVSRNPQGICAISDFVSAHGTLRFSAVWEPPTNFYGDVVQETIINLAGYRKNVGDAWDFYFSSGAWREALTGLDPRAAAKVLAEKGLLEPENERHLGKSINVPGRGKQRLYHIKACTWSSAHDRDRLACGGSKGPRRREKHGTRRNWGFQGF